MQANGDLPSWAYWLGAGLALGLIKFLKDTIRKTHANETRDRGMSRDNHRLLVSLKGDVEELRRAVGMLASHQEAQDLRINYLEKAIVLRRKGQ